MSQNISLGGQVGGDVLIAGRDVNVLRVSRGDRLDARNRLILLEKVERFWVEGVLESSLHGAARLELDMQARPGSHPWGMVLQTAAQPPVTTRESIAGLFMDAGGALLILGAPGSGKTITLLELARDLLVAARQDDTLPVPVVFNLASWGGEPFEAWLVNELNARYLVPRRTAATWIDEHGLLLLLDGLDEVAPDHREGCVRAINAFRAERGFIPMTVCSRTADYEALRTHLNVDAAVVIQALTEVQITEYLADPAFAGVRALLAEDDALAELARSPLMLSVMALAYHGLSRDELGRFWDVDARRRHLFDAYITHMFERRPRITEQGPLLRRLGWLAGRMLSTNQTIFHVERLQPVGLGCLPQVLYRLLAFCLVFTGVIALALALAAPVSVTLVAADALSLGLAESLSNVRAVLAAALPVGATTAVIAGAVAALKRHIQPMERLRWSWRTFGRRVLARGLLAGAMVVLIVVLAGLALTPLMLLISRVAGLTLDIVGIFGAVATAFTVSGGIGVVMLPLLLVFSIVTGGIEAEQSDVLPQPNEGIRRALRYAAVALVATAIVTGVVSSLLVGVIVSVVVLPQLTTLPPLPRFDFVLAGLVVLSFPVTLFLSLGAALYFGGLAVVQHAALRIVLAAQGNLPLRAVPFLNQADDLILLRRVGGGYIFIHRLLAEHLARVG